MSVVYLYDSLEKMLYDMLVTQQTMAALYMDRRFITKLFEGGGFRGHYWEYEFGRIRLIETEDWPAIMALDESIAL